LQRLSKDFILLNFSDGDLIAINFDGGLFNWALERWTQNVGIAQKIWFQENVSNSVFCLTKQDSLFTINMTDGTIINRIAMDRHDYNVYFDYSQNAIVLKNSEFMIGVDPVNGNQLWKIKHNVVDKVELIGNSVLSLKTMPESKDLLINIYNRDKGSLIWSKNVNIPKSFISFPAVGPLCRTTICDYCEDVTAYIEEYSDESLLLILHDEIIKIDAEQSNASAVHKEAIHLQIARTHEESGQTDQAIKEYKLLLKQNQMSQDAHWELANIYKEKKNTDEAIKSLLNYY